MNERKMLEENPIAGKVIMDNLRKLSAFQLLSRLASYGFQSEGGALVDCLEWIALWERFS